MRALRRFLKRLISWTTREEDEERLRVEIEEHLVLQIAENVRAGLSPAEARRQAVLRFGAVEAIREEYRAQKGFPFLETLIQDTRHALRRLRKAPAFSITTVLTLALGIGATTSIFTLVYAVLLKSLAVANPGELLMLGKEARCCYAGGYSEEHEFSLVSYDLYKHFRDHTTGFAELAAFSAGEPMFGVRRSGASEVAQAYPGEFVSGNYFSMFGINMYAGRPLAPPDDQANAAPVAVMSYRLWQQKYGSDPSIIGGIFDFDGKPFPIIGISPPGFYGDSLRPNPPDFFLPLNAEPLIDSNSDLNQPDAHRLDLIGRMRPGERPSAIQAQMRVELKGWLRSHWGEMSANDRAKFPEQTLFLTAGGAGITGMRAEYEHWLQVLMMVSAFVLLIVCANVANLMLVRGVERRRHISLSMALGAQWPRILRQVLTESVLLSLLGGAAGLFIAYAGTRLILHFVFPSAGGWAGVPIDATPSMPVLLFAFAISLLTGLAFGIAPAWMNTRVDPIDALRGANRFTERTGSGARKTLVILQAVLALILLSTSGLLITALQSLENQDFGFDQDHRIVMNIDLRLGGYRPQQLHPLYRRIEDSLSSIPGIAKVAICIYSPLGSDSRGDDVWIEGHPPPGPRDDGSTLWDRVTAGYFNAIGNPIVRGRAISTQDSATTRRVAVVNEAFARKFFHNQDPIGKHFGRADTGDSRQYEIIGIVQNARYLWFDLDKPIPPFYFVPEAQHDLSPKGEFTESDVNSHYLHDVVIATQPGASVSFVRLRQAVASIDPNLPIVSIRTLKEQVAEVFRQQRLIARLTSFFGVLSLVLSCIGLYGVTAYNARRRTSEIGVRMAMGAGRGQVIALVLRGAFALILLGLLIGLPLTFAVGRLLGSQLYGTSPYNPVVTLIGVVVLGLSALVASLIPALRASSVSPLEALRTE